MQFEYASAEINPVVESMMFEYVPVYNLLLKYEYDVDVDARDPAIMEPVALTRDGVDDVRARTARLFVERLTAPDLLRDTTPRDEVKVPDVVRVAAVPREETARFVPVPRDIVVLDAVFVFTERVARAVVARDVFARFVVFVVARGLVRVARWGKTFEVAIGSANTDRIETNVEQTKNAAANRNIVPIAFFNEFAFTRNVIKISCSLFCAKVPKIWFLVHKTFLDI